MDALAVIVLTIIFVYLVRRIGEWLGIFKAFEKEPDHFWFKWLK